MSLAFLKAVDRYCGLSHPTELEAPAIASSKRIKSIQTFIFAALALGVAGSTGIAEQKTSGPYTGNAACVDKANACYERCTAGRNAPSSGFNYEQCVAGCSLMLRICSNAAPVDPDLQKSGSKKSKASYPLTSLRNGKSGSNSKF